MKNPLKKAIQLAGGAGIVTAVYIFSHPNDPVPAFLRAWFDSKPEASGTVADGGAFPGERGTIFAMPFGANNAPPQGDENNLEKLDSYVASVVKGTRLSEQEKFRTLWGAYEKNRSSEWLARYYLGALHAIPVLPYTGVMIAELNKPDTNAKSKGELIALLASAHSEAENATSPTASSAKSAIIEAVKAQISNPDPILAKAATLAYSRMDYGDDMRYVLNDAYRRNLISEAEFVRETVYKLPNISDRQEQQSTFADLVLIAQNSRSPESGEALSGALEIMLRNPQASDRLGGETKASLQNYLRSTEPKVTVSGSDFSMDEAMRYADWLNSYASLKTRSGVEKTQLIVSVLASDATETPKIAAVLVSMPEPAVIEGLRGSGRVDTIRERLQTELARMPRDTSAQTVYEAALGVIQ